MARTNSMADISQYLSDSNERKAPLVPLDVDAASDAVGAPVPEDTTTTQDESTEQAEETNVEDAEENERESIKQMRKAQLDASNLREEKNETARATQKAIESAKEAVSSAQQVLDKSKLAVGKIPIPGDLILPLSVLLVFFLALIPVNGHTRLMWLWLTLTNNASVTEGAGASFGTTKTTGGAGASFGTTLPVSGTTTGIAPLTGTVNPISNGLVPLVPFTGATSIFGGLSAIFTGVEDIL